MNYNIHYNKLIKRAKERQLSGYKEKHHIIPKCLGGTDNSSNIVVLTAREHYIAHQLLVKIHPNNHRLIKAANMMCTFSVYNEKRSKNRLYEWLRIKMSNTMKIEQSGIKNSQYGTCWIYSIEKSASKKIPKQELNEWMLKGWQRGRIINFNNIQICKRCGNEFIHKNKHMYCSDVCRKKQKIENRENRPHPLDSRTNEFLTYYQNTGSINKSLKLMGFLGAQGWYYTWAKSVLDLNSDAPDTGLLNPS